LSYTDGSDRTRFAEVDSFRGVAVLGMVIYHVLFDLSIIGLIEVGIQNTYFEVLAEVTAASFFVIVGVSMYISFSREERKGENPMLRAKKYISRGLKLVGLGAIITGITYLLYPEFAVLFGALHFIGSSVILSYILLELTRTLELPGKVLAYGIVLGVVFWLAGPVSKLEVSHPFLIWLGTVPPGFQSLDYFPLLPWFGFVVSGLILGQLVYPQGRRRVNFFEFGARPAQFLGRNALIIYFAHQPAIYLGIFLFMAFTGQVELSALSSF
jgi:uncharacterized membrane protein